MEKKERNKKKIIIIAIIILAVGIILMLGKGYKIQALTTEDGKYEYEELSDGSIEITNYKGNETNAKIPSKINGKNVTSISALAFYRCSSLVSINIPEGVTSIGKYAFSSCSSLSSIKVADGNTKYTSAEGVLYNKEKTKLIKYPAKKEGTEYTILKGVTSIGEQAFYECSSLESINIPEGVTSIGDWAFSGCSSLESISIPSSVTSIGVWAFYSCSSLSSINIPEGVTSIGYGAFYSCSSLSSINIPSSVTSIGDLAFNYCSSLSSIKVADGNTKYTSAEGVLYNKEKTELIKYPAKKEGTEYTILESVTSIGDDAFAYCSSLESINIPECICQVKIEPYYN